MLQKFTGSIFSVLILFFCGQDLLSQTKNSISVSEQKTANAFPLFTNTVIPTFYYDGKDAKVVQIAA